MKIKILNESGYKEAMLGLSLSYNVSDFDRIEKVARKLAGKDGGHNKFLESIVVWIDITAARYWWQLIDTYRVGVTKQSESTTHTIMKHELTSDNFERHSNYECVPCDVVDWLNDMIRRKEFLRIKMNLPESFLQRRIVCTNYKTLRNIILQRWDHRLPEWQQFCMAMLIGNEGVQYPSLLPNPWEKKEK